MADPIHHDWQRIVSELLITGQTQASLARECSCSPAYIHKIKEGGVKGDLGTSIGTKLLNLHRYHCRVKPSKENGQ